MTVVEALPMDIQDALYHYCRDNESLNDALIRALHTELFRWHDLRKAPEDLPPVHSSVFNEDCDKVVYVGQGKWEEYSEYYEKYVEADPPVAWCELPKFEGGRSKQ